MTAGGGRAGPYGTRLPARGKSEHHKASCRVQHAGAVGESWRRRKVSQKTNRPGNGVRVKRRGKSSPPDVQTPGHEKPHEVQDRTGGGLPARPGFRQRHRAAPGLSSHPALVSGGGPGRGHTRRGQINGHHGPLLRKGKRADRIRLTVVPRRASRHARGVRRNDFTRRTISARTRCSTPCRRSSCRCPARGRHRDSACG